MAFLKHFVIVQKCKMPALHLKTICLLLLLNTNDGFSGFTRKKKNKALQIRTLFGDLKRLQKPFKDHLESSTVGAIFHTNSKYSRYLAILQGGGKIGSRLQQNLPVWLKCLAI